MDLKKRNRSLHSIVEHSEYVGRIAIGKVFAGKITEGQPVTVIDAESLHTQQKVMHIHQFHSLGRKQVSNVQAGDICAISGLDPVEIGDTIACADKPSRLAVIFVDEPTMTMTFRVNNGPFAGRDGKYVTSRQIEERLEKELQQNVALRVEEGQNPEEFNVSGRWLMHHTFERYELMRGAISQRKVGVMIATTTGQVTAYALDALSDRGIFFVEPGEKVYEGQVVGEHCKEKDVPVNVVKSKQLTNIRAAGKDDSAKVRPARKMSLEASSR